MCPLEYLCPIILNEKAEIEGVAKNLYSSCMIEYKTDEWARLDRSAYVCVIRSK